MFWSNFNKTNYYLVYPWLTSLLRPIYTITVMESIRKFSTRYLRVIQGSLPMVVFILLFVFYFSWIGQRIFSDTVEGVSQFDTFFNSFWSMFVLITTSNFPMVMLPSYNTSRAYCIFFILFLVIGLFLLMNLLLAIFYSSYQNKTELAIDRFATKRSKYIFDLF